jgi:DNA-binding transcriptional MerR regulator
MTVTRLAQACGLSRSAVLYYESIGLLTRPRRTAGNCRAYGETDLARLRQICVYRGAGLKLADIQTLLAERRTGAAAVLKRRLSEIAAEIDRLREHQRAIAQLLKHTVPIRSDPMITKEKWTQIMKSAGFTADDMHRWHAEFEKSAPNEHQEFLEFLQIPANKVDSIREWSRRFQST